MSPLPTIHILYTDNDEDERFLFEQSLINALIPYELKLIENGKNLLRYLNSTPQPQPDVIFLDFSMPVMNGLECLQAIRQLPQLKEVPVILFSNSTDPRHVDESLAMGANRFVRKPHTLEDEAKILGKMLGYGWKETLQKIDKDSFLVKDAIHYA